MIAIALTFLATLGSCLDTEPALNGLDPVHLCEGREVAGAAEHEAAHGAYTYRFASAETRERFLADPERWGVQWGGRCGRMGPLSGAGNPDRFAVHGARIFLFASDACRDRFAADPGSYLAAPAALPEHDEAAREAGAGWVERLVQGHGGAQVLDAAGALELTAGSVQDGWHNRVTLRISRDGELVRTSEWTAPRDPLAPDDEPETTRTTWTLGAHSSVDEGRGEVELTSPDQLRDLRRLGHREILPLLWQRGREDFVAVDLGAGELDGRPVQDVLVQVDGLVTTLHVDPDTNLVAGLSWRGRLFEGRTRDVVETVTSWTLAGGAVLPAQRDVALDGEPRPAAHVSWDDARALPAAPSDAYRRR